MFTFLYYFCFLRLGHFFTGFVCPKFFICIISHCCLFNMVNFCCCLGLTTLPYAEYVSLSLMWNMDYFVMQNNPYSTQGLSEPVFATHLSEIVIELMTSESGSGSARACSL